MLALAALLEFLVMQVTTLPALHGLPQISGADAGLRVLAWLRGKSGRPIRDASHRAERGGVGLYPAAPFDAKPPKRTAILLGYAALHERDIREGIRSVGRGTKVRNRPARRPRAVGARLERGV